MRLKIRSRPTGEALMTVSASRSFICQRCGAEVYRPERDHLDDWVCLNCRYGRVRSSQP